MKPFLQGKKNLDVASMRLPPGFGPTSKTVGAVVRHTTPSDAPNEPHGATVDTVKEGDKIVRLIVTCTCGERVEIECLYNAGV